jgi:1,4-alpha-glucan branching enzyme
MILRNVSEFTVCARFPFAQAVYLLGEFNRWSTATTPMSYVGRGVWEAKLRLESGPSRLAYFVWQHGRPFGQIVYQEDGSEATAEVQSPVDAAYY